MPDIVGSSASRSHRLRSKILRRAFFNGLLGESYEHVRATAACFAENSRLWDVAYTAHPSSHAPPAVDLDPRMRELLTPLAPYLAPSK